MAKTCIAFPGDTKLKFSDHTPEILEEANQKWCNIFIENKWAVAKTFTSIVLQCEFALSTDIIHPSRRYGDYWIYDFPQVLGAYDYRDFKTLMTGFFPRAEVVDYMPAPWFLFNGVMMEFIHNPIPMKIYKDLQLYHKRYTNLMREIMTGNYLKTEDTEFIQDIAKFISVTKVAEKMNIDIEQSYQPSVERVIDTNYDSTPIGDSVTFAYVALKRSMHEFKKFFINNFNIPFTTYDELEYESELTSRTILEAEGLISNGTCYIAGDEKITDFIIKVKYEMTLADGGKRYIVDLVWDKVAADVEFPSIFTTGPFKQKISHYWPFHFNGNDKHINLLHKAVTNTVAPEIFPLAGFWFHRSGTLLACENCVYDIEKWVMYERDGLFYFNHELRTGFMVHDNLGSNMLLTTSGMPTFHLDTPSHSIDEYLEYFAQFYTDDKGWFLFCYVLGLIYAGVFRHVQDFKFPYLILFGKYGSGKSGISDMIKRVFNIVDLEKWQTKYWETSPFSFLNQCASRPWLPMFITEFKEVNEQGDQKVSTLVSMYDRALISKWLPSQKLVYYPLNALGVIDGEELPRRSAMKSRSVIIKVDAHKNAFGLTKYKEEINKPILSHLWADALRRKPATGDYKTYIAEASAWLSGKYPKASNRTIELFSCIYAGCLLFDENMREYAQAYIAPYFQAQLMLEAETYGDGEMMEIIKRHARQLSGMDCYFYDRSNKKFCLRIWPFESFIHRYHIKMSLGVEALRQYFPCIEDIEDPSGWLTECATWKVNEFFPKSLMFCPDAYQDYKVIMWLATPDPFQ